MKKYEGCSAGSKFHQNPLGGHLQRAVSKFVIWCCSQFSFCSFHTLSLHDALPISDPVLLFGAKPEYAQRVIKSPRISGHQFENAKDSLSALQLSYLFISVLNLSFTDFHKFWSSGSTLNHVLRALEAPWMPRRCFGMILNLFGELHF